MKITNSSILLSLLFILTVSCSDDDSDSGSADDNDDSQPTEDGKITATINGEDHEEVAVANVDDSGPVTFTEIDGQSGTNSGTIRLSVPLIPGETGTFDESDISDGGLTIMYELNSTGFSPSLTDADITIEVTEYTDSSISGTFTGTLVDSVGDEPDINISNGTFTNIEVTQE